MPAFYRSVFLASAALALLAAPASAAESIKVPGYITDALADPGRPPEDIARDKDIKPGEMLAFSHIKPGDKVVEMYPAFGYWVRTFSKIVGPKGHVNGITMMRDMGEPRRDRERQRTGELKGILMVDGTLGLENIKEYSNTTALWESVSQYGGNVALPEQVDMIWCDHYHDMHDDHTGSLDMLAVNRSIFQDLKPGGIYLIADNVGLPGSGIDGHVQHRSDPELLKQQVLAAGFVLEEESNMLRRNDDDHNHPTNKLAVRDTSDRVLYRFRKPATVNGDNRPKGADPLANYYGNTFIFNVGATGDTTGNRVRHIFYNKDGTYEEFGIRGKGPAPMQQGQWFWDAAGHNCMLHSFPVDERGFVVCQDAPMKLDIDKVVDVKRGDGAVKVELVKGHTWPDLSRDK